MVLNFDEIRKAKNAFLPDECDLCKKKFNKDRTVQKYLCLKHTKCTNICSFCATEIEGKDICELCPKDK